MAGVAEVDGGSSHGRQVNARGNFLMGETLRRPRGRPAGSKNKPKQPIIITRESANAMRAHAIEVNSGCDINETLINFSRRKQRGLFVLNATGCATNVTIRRPASSGSVITLHGRFEIFSLLGSILPPPAVPGVSAGLTVYLAGTQGQAVGGSVVGALIASGPVVIMVATFDHLPLEDDEIVAAANHNQQYQNNRRLHWIDFSEIYGVQQNLLTNGTVPSEMYTWAPAPGRRTLSKS
ncbi:unnamed protein product [Fraxinus pennsylvanica]|uniref:PPC domain-containing protein n=1 Tax=Fraxinus pennsylvanica TaxID=56036 RepID=A0AAD2A515_9LAMI|nr:unnamed protein product [Fraxinus pennsylvanica]